MKVIGLTGGIGSGKTTIAKMFNELGIPIYFADIEAKRIMAYSTKVKNKLIDKFGKEAYLNGELNRKYLAEIVFKNREQLSSINNIVHPEVENHFKTWIKDQNAPFIIQENALIFENNKQNSFDIIITITAPLEDRIQRIRDRDQVTKEQILDRIKNQLDDEFKINNSDFVIDNIELAITKSQVKAIYDQLLQLSQN